MAGSFDDAYQLCAIDPPTFADGTCSGDSGGPLVAQRPDGTWVEIGITSWGTGRLLHRAARFLHSR